MPPTWSYIKPMVAIGCISMALCVVHLLTRDSLWTRSSQLSKSQLIQILRDIAREFHSIFTEIAQIAAAGRVRLANEVHDTLTEEQLENILMQQGVQDRLKGVQDEIYRRHKTNAEQTKLAEGQFADDEDVKVLVFGLKKMYEDSLKGFLPILPGCEIPGALTQTKVLEILKTINNLKLEKFQTVLESWKGEEDAWQYPMELTKAADAAEADILKKEGEIFRHDAAIFQSALAKYSTNPSFAKKKKEMDARHQKFVKGLLKKKHFIKTPKIVQLD
eukprot:Filipodium_phascolosomae@DN574_c0_g1_i1.p1